MFIDVQGGKLFALRSGPQSGTAIVAIGGWIGSSELWLEPLASLSDAYVTVSYDHRGAGLSTCTVGSITFDALVHDALTVLDAFGIHRCVLAAESAGAQTALAVAGPTRLLFGTDSSFFPRGWQRPVLDAQRAVLQRLGVPADDQAAILGGNFDRLFA